MIGRTSGRQITVDSLGISRLYARRLFSAIAPSPVESRIGLEYSFFDAKDLSKLSSVFSGTHSASGMKDIQEIYKKAGTLGFDSSGAVFILKCLSQVPERDSKKLLTEAILRIEEEYFSGDMNWLNPSSPYSRLLVNEGLVSPQDRISFRTLIHSLPIECKALLIGFSEEKHMTKPKKRLSPEEIKGRWHNRDPVDMETLERDHYLKTNQILRTRYVKAEPSPVPVGARLRQALGMEFIERLESLSVDDFVTLASCLLSAPRNGVFHRDLKMDAQFVISKKILKLSHEEVGRYIIPLALILSRFEHQLETPSRVWNRSIIPAIRKELVQVSQVPDMYRDLNESSRWALLTASLLSCGRVKVTSRLMKYLEPNISVDTLDEEIAGKLVDGLVTAGFSSSTILGNIAAAKLWPIWLKGKVLNARNHFGLFGNDYDDLAQSLVEDLMRDQTQLVKISSVSQVMLVNSLLASDCVDKEPLAGMLETICTRLPDLDVETLGRIDSALE